MHQYLLYTHIKYKNSLSGTLNTAYPTSLTCFTALLVVLLVKYIRFYKQNHGGIGNSIVFDVGVIGPISLVYAHKILISSIRDTK